MIRKLQKEKYIQSVCGNMPLVGDQAAALTGVAVGLRMDWRNTHSGRKCVNSLCHPSCYGNVMLLRNTVSPEPEHKEQ
jgi:hypothetical protein